MINKLILSAIFVAACIGLNGAHTLAETSPTRIKKSTTTTTTTTTESDSEEEIEPVTTPPALEPASPKEFIVSATFGSKATSGMAGCKTEALSEQAIRDLKGDCNAWIKDQKKELKTKFNTGTCEEQCSDCGMGLRRCTVSGVVHYSK